MTKEVQKKLSDPIQYLKGIGPGRAKILSQLGIITVEDLLYYLPDKYSDRREPIPIRNLKDGEEATIKARVKDIPRVKKINPRLELLEITVSDGTGNAMVTWFNQTYLKDRMPPGTEIAVSGKVQKRLGSFYFRNFDYEILGGQETIHVLRIVPFYTITEGITQRHFRVIVKWAVDNYFSSVPEILPEEIIKKHELLSISEAIRNVHFPEDPEKYQGARRRLAFDELFLFQLALALRRIEMEKERKELLYVGESTLTQRFIKILPFELTAAQIRVIDEVSYDMTLPKPMNRLLQGDVGSGKTVVATCAMLKAIENGYQSAIMAPTEILAQQHYFTFQEMLKDLRIRIELLIGSVPEKEKKWIRQRIKDGQADIIIGTHALIEKGVTFPKLGLVIVDEQHKFGVVQRSTLRKKALKSDMLVMTATPIPRSLALTVYGDLDISTLDEMPPGRKDVETFVLPPQKRMDAYHFIAEEVKMGRQAFVVYPLVEESPTSELNSAKAMRDYLQKEIFPDLRLGLIHGQMSGDEKDKAMVDFKDKKINILVATTVIEVGIDVPNASVMLIENAERFGLPQLHQLRGRIGRGPYQSYCLLLQGHEKGLTEEAKERVSVMSQTSDGFKIAEKDLEIRGPGTFFGIRQHGLSDLRVADLVKDQKLLVSARQEAFALIKNCPTLYRPEYRLLKHALRVKFQRKVEVS